MTKKKASSETPTVPEHHAPRERTFVDAHTGETIAHPHKGGSGAEATQAIRDEMHAGRKGNSLPFRIGAFVLWALGLVCEVLAILVLNGTLFIPGFSKMTWVIIWLVVDLVLVVIGSQLWKHANHVSPAAKSNKLAYWVQTDLGVIVAAIAFAPIVVLMLTNKDTDKRTKQVGSVVAVVALVAALASGVDYNPTTQEDLDQAEAGAAVLSDNGLVYFTPFGKVYHFNPDCQYLKNSSTIYAGTVDDALESGRNRGCSGCTVEGGTDIITNSSQDALASALASVIKVHDEVPDAPGDVGADTGELEELPAAA